MKLRNGKVIGSEKVIFNVYSDFTDKRNNSKKEFVENIKSLLLKMESIRGKPLERIYQAHNIYTELLINFDLYKSNTIFLMTIYKKSSELPSQIFEKVNFSTLDTANRKNIEELLEMFQKMKKMISEYFLTVVDRSNWVDFVEKEKKKVIETIQKYLSDILKLGASSNIDIVHKLFVDFYSNIEFFENDKKLLKVIYNKCVELPLQIVRKYDMFDSESLQKKTIELLERVKKMIPDDVKNDFHIFKFSCECGKTCSLSTQKCCKCSDERVDSAKTFSNYRGENIIYYGSSWGYCPLCNECVKTSVN